jgi:EAL domain-containing protein (putative c-di-GMP-specific phosphodiesterase class I)
VRLFVRMARVLHIETVADGVTDEAARNVLKSLGVGSGIGPAFGRARPVAALLKAASHSEPRAA